MRNYNYLSEGFIDRQFDRIDPDEHRELSRRGGVHSGQVRRRKALLRRAAFDALAAHVMRMNARREFLDAVETVMKAERRKRKRRKWT